MRFAPVAAAMFVAVMVGVSGCTGVPDREREAGDIRSRIAAMPGVSDVGLIYDNGILEGTRFELAVSMDQATDQQVGAVAAQIDELRGKDFAKFDQRVKIIVAKWTSLSAGTDLPDDIEHVSGLVRRLRADVPAGEMSWFSGAAPDASKIEVRDAEEPGAAVDAILRIFADRPPSGIEVSAADRVADPHWMIVNRFTPADKQRIDQQLAAAAPADPGWIGVRDGRIDHFTFGVPTRETAYEDIVRTIHALEAGPEHPVSLTWAWPGIKYRYDEPRWAGTAMIGKCEYVNGDRTVSEPLLPEALALQQRIRDEFDTCLK
ncbi:hypothetical protein [Mycolicibacterium peregrinum]|uniref:Lipoprotein n=1 Tax=Mycolicibacterium peregrinum TaxID=43304 RepID=A0A1A0V912_MYCPR|nr:hypothetical protein [Mycolicibacterium peregrinum]OBB79676.1 hypothetical protein A5779_12345 [Mycolicibacterium peregrinum]